MFVAIFASHHSKNFAFTLFLFCCITRYNATWRAGNDESCASLNDLCWELLKEGFFKHLRKGAKLEQIQRARPQKQRTFVFTGEKESELKAPAGVFYASVLSSFEICSEEKSIHMRRQAAPDQNLASCSRQTNKTESQRVKLLLLKKQKHSFACAGKMFTHTFPNFCLSFSSLPSFMLPFLKVLRKIEPNIFSSSRAQYH